MQKRQSNREPVNDFAIVTLAIGEQSFWSLTIDTHRRYAERIGASHFIIDEIDAQIGAEVKLQKFQIFGLLEKFSRIIYLDADIIVRDSCPDLFDIVPEDKLGVVAESLPYFERRDVFLEACMSYYRSAPPADQHWFNSGMMVLSREYRDLFLPPLGIRKFSARNMDGTIAPPRFSWLDMPLLNARAVALKIPIHYLDYRYNFLQPLTDYLKDEQGPHGAFIFHACGEDKEALLTVYESWHLHSKSRACAI